jgi:transcriptional regulator with XRE-family HTH domain
MSQSAYSKYENNKHTPNIAETIRMCELLHIPFNKVKSLVTEDAAL